VTSEEVQYFFYRLGIEYVFGLAPAAASYANAEANKT
jgi:hypothetical protein